MRRKYQGNLIRPTRRLRPALIRPRPGPGVVGVLAGAGLFGLATPASAASDSTWDRGAAVLAVHLGGLRRPAVCRAGLLATKDQQVAIAENTLAGQGWGAWTCAAIVSAAAWSTRGGRST